MAVIHPIAPEDDVRQFLEDVGWSDVADDEFTFEQADGSELSRTIVLHLRSAAYLNTHQVYLSLYQYLAPRPFARYSVDTWILVASQDGLSLSSFATLRRMRPSRSVCTNFAQRRVQ